jgi:hypothetical protein
MVLEMRNKWVLVLLIFGFVSTQITFGQTSGKTSSSLGEVINDYKANPIRGELNWKGKQIELTAHAFIDSFREDGSLVIRQLDRKEWEAADAYKAKGMIKIWSPDDFFHALCSFKSSEKQKLASYDEGAAIKINGTIEGIVRSGYRITLVVKNCTVITEDGRIGSETSGLVGRWLLLDDVQLDYKIKELELLRDGSGFVEFLYNNNKYGITWKTENGIIIVLTITNSPRQEVVGYAYKLSGEILTLRGEDGISLLYKKK